MVLQLQLSSPLAKPVLRLLRSTTCRLLTVCLVLARQTWFRQRFGARRWTVFRAIRAAIVVFAALLAMFVPGFGNFISLIGEPRIPSVYAQPQQLPSICNTSSCTPLPVSAVLLAVARVL